MAADKGVACIVCGASNTICTTTEVVDGKAATRNYCSEHVPSALRESIPFGTHRTPAEEVAFLRSRIAAAESQVSDPVSRAQFKDAVEQLIDDIDAGRRRLGDAD